MSPTRVPWARECAAPKVRRAFDHPTAAGAQRPAEPVTAPRDDVASELIAFARFLAGLPRLVRRRMTVAEALAIVQDRLRHRERNFLAVLERGIYENPR